MSSPTAVRTGQFQYQGHTLAYELHGAPDGQPCVLVHGILLDSLLNRGLARRFASLGYQVALLDLLGHGKSDRSSDPKEHRVDFYADQVLALLDHLRWPQALVGGVSLGCITALTVAVKAPRRVNALFLEMPVMEWSAPWAALILAPLLVGSRYNPLVHARLARMVRLLPRPPIDWLASAMNAISNEPKVVAAILHGVLVGPLVPTLAERRRLTMPTLIIGHSGDKLHEHRDARALAAQLPNATLLMAKSILELRLRPARLWPQIATFLKSVPVPTSVKDERPLVSLTMSAASRKQPTVSAPAKTATKKTATQPPAAKATAPRKAVTKSAPAQKVAVKKAAVKQAAVKKPVAKKAAARRAAAKRAPRKTPRG